MVGLQPVLVKSLRATGLERMGRLADGELELFLDEFFVLRTGTEVEVLQDGRVVPEVFVVKLHDDVGCLKHVPSVVDPSPQV